MSKPLELTSQGHYSPTGIVMVDEPTHIGVSVFSHDGSAIMTIDARDGGNVNQVMVGLTANMVLQLAERLTRHADVIRAAIDEGKGGASLRAEAPTMEAARADAARADAARGAAKFS